MGAVYLATDLTLKRAVAVKTLTCASVPPPDAPESGSLGDGDE